MAQPEFRIRIENGQVTVEDAQPGGQTSRPEQFQFTVSEDEQTELRQYLETFSHPLYPNTPMAMRAESLVRRIGGDLFRAVFSSPVAVAIYDRMKLALERSTLVVVATTGQAQSLPWELLYDPSLTGSGEPWLALRVGRLIRRTKAEPAPAPRPAGDTLRVLLVICRPRDADLPFLSVGRELLTLARSNTYRMTLTVVRPRTFVAFAESLHNNDYDIVHFDGHGSLLSDGHAVLWFEQLGGEGDPVGADRLALELLQAKVPVLVMNACLSGTTPRALNPSLGQELIDRQVPAVVAMAGMVRMDTAELFVRTVYSCILDGQEVAESVRIARTVLRQNRTRTTEIGTWASVGDWALPVFLESTPVGALVRVEPVRSAPAQPLREANCRDVPSGSALGRDGVFLWIEDRVNDGARAVIILGQPLMGTTETAVEFARWYSATLPPLTDSPTAHFPPVVRIPAAHGFKEEAVLNAVVQAYPEARTHQTPEDRTLRERALAALARDRGILIIELTDIELSASLLKAAAEVVHEFTTHEGGLALVILNTLTGWPYMGMPSIELPPLRPEYARTCLVRELERFKKTRDPDLVNQSPVSELIGRGQPGEITEFARGVLDPDVKFNDRLVWACCILAAIQLLSLAIAYAVPSTYWERMFDQINWDPNASRELPKEGNWRFLSWGFLVELLRGWITVGVGLYFAAGWIFRAEFRALFLRPGRRAGEPPYAGLFRWVLLFLVIFASLLVLVYHLTRGPEDLWRIEGNPASRKPLSEGKNIDRARPSGPDEVGKYYRDCVLPYAFYFFYSWTCFGVLFPVLLTLCIYNAVLVLLDVKQVEAEFGRNPDPKTLCPLLANYRERLWTGLDKFAVLLMLAAAALFYESVIACNNLMPAAAKTFAVCLVAFPAVWILLLGAAWYADNEALQLGTRRLPEGQQEPFRRQNRWVVYFRGRLERSPLLTLAAILCVLGIVMRALASRM